jgi:hypothetical protein
MTTEGVLLAWGLMAIAGFLHTLLRGLWFGDKKMRQANESRAHSG